MKKWILFYFREKFNPTSLLLFGRPTYIILLENFRWAENFSLLSIYVEKCECGNEVVVGLAWIPYTPVPPSPMAKNLVGNLASKSLAPACSSSSFSSYSSSSSSSQRIYIIRRLCDSKNCRLIVTVRRTRAMKMNFVPVTRVSSSANRRTVVIVLVEGMENGGRDAEEAEEAKRRDATLVPT